MDIKTKESEFLKQLAVYRNQDSINWKKHGNNTTDHSAFNQFKEESLLRHERLYQSFLNRSRYLTLRNAAIYRAKIEKLYQQHQDSFEKKLRFRCNIVNRVELAKKTRAIVPFDMSRLPGFSLRGDYFFPKLEAEFKYCHFNKLSDLFIIKGGFCLDKGEKKLYRIFEYQEIQAQRLKVACQEFLMAHINEQKDIAYYAASHVELRKHYKKWAFLSHPDKLDAQLADLKSYLSSEEYSGLCQRVSSYVRDCRYNEMNQELIADIEADKLVVEITSVAGRLYVSKQIEAWEKDLVQCFLFLRGIIY